MKKTTFDDMLKIMQENGWELIEKKTEYEHIKRKNKQITARIGWLYFKLKEEPLVLNYEAKMWKEKYENAVKTMEEVMQNLEEMRQCLNKLDGDKI